MATPIISVDTQHNDMIHDSQFDYYGRKLATCSSDRSIKIFEVSGELCQQSATILDHEGPVWLFIEKRHLLYGKNCIHTNFMNPL